jgi:two-component system NtrC family response regulator
LITGETGTGKDVLAKFIYQLSPRNKHNLIAINCAAMQPTMLESELFGHEAGAFTHAVKRKKGLMELADDGVLFLDEISAMPTNMQAKLLRVLQEKNFRRVGGVNEIYSDFMVVAASNRILQKLIDEGKFREDLYYRLKVIDLHLPSLRDRKEDIPELVGFFIHKFNLARGVSIQDITPRALEALKAYNWPGNIRELENAIERAVIFCDDATIDTQHLPGEVNRVLA